MQRIEKSQHEFVDDFWRENFPKLQQYCRFLAQNHWDGEDIAQETFLKALKYPNPTTALLKKIAYHHWIDLHRKRKFESVDLEAATESHTFSFENTTETVELLMKNFTPKQALIFLLKEAFQYQSKEIAEILETPETAVKAILHRAKQRLGKDVSVESFWDLEVRDRMADLFYNALKNQDPTILIGTLPTLKEVPKMFTPTSTLCMAA